MKYTTRKVIPYKQHLYFKSQGCNRGLSIKVFLRFLFDFQIKLGKSQRKEELDGIVDDLDSTEDGEACEEAHCAANQTKS